MMVPKRRGLERERVASVVVVVVVVVDDGI
jgi:hypothetical protein